MVEPAVSIWPLATGRAAIFPTGRAVVPRVPESQGADLDAVSALQGLGLFSLTPAIPNVSLTVLGSSRTLQRVAGNPAAH